MGEAAEIPECRRGRGGIEGSGDGDKGHPGGPTVAEQLRPCASLAETGRANVAGGGGGRTWRVRHAARRTVERTGGKRSLAEDLRHATYHHHERGGHFVRARSGS